MPLVICAIVWLVLTEADPGSRLPGLGVVLCASGWRLLLRPRGCLALRPAGFLRFFPSFLGQSIISAIDVMRRTLAPRLSINPELLSYRTTLPEGSPRLFFANTISLLPGTLSADLHGDVVMVHVLDRRSNARDSLRNLEKKVAGLFQAATPAERDSPCSSTC